MVEICSCLHYAQGATATVELYPRSHRQSRQTPCASLLIAAERKNHLALARAYNEANTVGIDESGTYKKRAVIKTVLCGDPWGERRQYSLNNKWV